MKLLLSCLLLLCAPLALATTVTIDATMPTQNVDNSLIPATGPGSLSGARVEYGTCIGTAFGTKVGEVARTVGAPGVTVSYTLNLDPGTSCVRVFVSNTYTVESDPSNVVTRKVDPPKPKAPTLATVAPQAYEVVPDLKHFWFNAGNQIGTVKLGAACDQARTVGDDIYAVVQFQAAVTLWPDVPPQEAVVAKCKKVTT
jgi:hypothetical protein